MNIDVAAAPQLLAAVPHAANPWPWLAVAAIVLIIAAIAFVGRRLAPYGV